jgi:hypothetical protein
MRVSAILGAALLAVSTGLYAQAPKGEPKDPDRAAKREQVKQAHEKAVKACEGKQGDERRDCIRKEVCAQSKDPKACEARVAKARDTHAKARKACEGKPDGERRDCMRKEMCASSKDPAKCEAQAKEWMAKRDKAREACKGKEGDALRSCMRDQMGGSSKK